MRSFDTRGRRTLLICGFLALALAITGSAFADEEEEMAAWEDVPEAVRAAIEANLPAAVGSAVEVEVDDGVTIYDAEVVADGIETSIEVSETGEVLEMEEEAVSADDEHEGDDDDDDEGEDDEQMIAWEDAPEAVRVAIEANLASAVGSSIEVEVEDGGTVYEAEIVADGIETSVEVNEAGEVLEIEQEPVDDDSVSGDDDDEDEDDD
ncbi:hypothetical protein JXA47_17345 [Candidatus Sumerlaeota bacterium]|nr:hypothetical protein [Candidatus Sumerlaeota bacterium]